MDGYIALEDIFVIGIRGMTGCSASALGLISTFPSQVARLEKQHVIYGGGNLFCTMPILYELHDPCAARFEKLLQHCGLYLNENLSQEQELWLELNRHNMPEHRHNACINARQDMGNVKESKQQSES
jgi:hypothetical protein